MVQNADDLTAFKSDGRSAQDIFKLLDQFEKCSGLRVNYTKPKHCGLAPVVITLKHLWY